LSNDLNLNFVHEMNKNENEQGVKIEKL
jgi:hypothetical protein